MNLEKLIALVATVTLLVGAMLSTPAWAGKESVFSALQGVDAQSLSSEEMGAISGQLNAYDIAATLVADAGNLGKYPKLQAADLQLADYFRSNAAAINASFLKLGVLTPCKSCQ